MSEIKAIQESIFHTMESMLSVEVQSEEPILRGRKNLKWIVTLSSGEKLFVKQYHQQRYMGKLSYVKKALAIQNTLQHQGVVCPKIHTWNGEYILTTPDGVLFSFMEVCKGEFVKPSHTTVKQMQSLGYELGKMHSAFRRLPASVLHWSPSKEHIQDEWEKQYKQAK
ncbi:hypothetical protein [Shimazuella alba]|uniref:Aminoglycoside phosphotransferase domain-containing protein n=1 Tax=Shimazuella alba TaxID=2690964 RepID=A0A6I4W2G4_9BACL|nr:hypothetical protein [Shimazuella alba]MXQ54964.1 hypothetical protein [Shimazuella alba]